MHQGELAQLLGLKQTQISSIETGAHVPTDSAFVQSLAQALHLSAEETAELQSAEQTSERRLILDKGAQSHEYLLLHGVREFAREMSAAAASELFEAMRDAATANRNSKQLPARHVQLALAGRTSP